MGQNKAPVIRPGTVAERVQNFNGARKIQLQRHKSLPQLPSEATNHDYRKRLRHVEPQSSQSQSSPFPWPKLRHFHRPSYKHSESYPLPCSTLEETPDIHVAAPRPLVPLRAGPYKNDEITARTRQRPFIQHICGHFEQAATVTVPNDDSNQHLIEAGAEGSFVIVGPHLQSSIVGERLQKIMSNGDAFVIPFPCGAGQKSSDGYWSRRSSTPTVPIRNTRATIDAQAAGDVDKDDSKSIITAVRSGLTNTPSQAHPALSPGASKLFPLTSRNELPLASAMSDRQQHNTPA
jgi:hypothetical protein